VSATVSIPKPEGWLRVWLSGSPHQVVSASTGTYLLRWFMLPHNRFLNMYLQTLSLPTIPSRMTIRGRSSRSCWAAATSRQPRPGGYGAVGAASHIAKRHSATALNSCATSVAAKSPAGHL
jgi:hypothetical protein